MWRGDEKCLNVGIANSTVNTKTVNMTILTRFVYQDLRGWKKNVVIITQKSSSQMEKKQVVKGLKNLKERMIEK